jgi:chemotaxis protein methyltransferase CheR
VLIFFDKESKKGVVKSFYNNTAKSGYFIMGNSESLFSVSEDYQMLHFPSAIIYKRRD